MDHEIIHYSIKNGRQEQIKLVKIQIQPRILLELRVLDQGNNKKNKK